MKDAYVVAACDHQPAVQGAVFDCGLKWLKATDSQVVFVNIEGQSNVLAVDEGAGYVPEISLDDLSVPTIDAPGNGENNSAGCNFVKFSGTRTVLFATGDALYAKLKSDGKTYRLA